MNSKPAVYSTLHMCTERRCAHCVLGVRTFGSRTEYLVGLTMGATPHRAERPEEWLIIPDTSRQEWEGGSLSAGSARMSGRLARGKRSGVPASRGLGTVKPVDGSLFVMARHTEFIITVSVVAVGLIGCPPDPVECGVGEEARCDQKNEVCICGDQRCATLSGDGLNEAMIPSAASEDAAFRYTFDDEPVRASLGETRILEENGVSCPEPLQDLCGTDNAKCGPAEVCLCDRGYRRCARAAPECGSGNDTEIGYRYGFDGLEQGGRCVPPDRTLAPLTPEQSVCPEVRPRCGVPEGTPGRIECGQDQVCLCGENRCAFLDPTCPDQYRRALDGWPDAGRCVADGSSRVARDQQCPNDPRDLCGTVAAFVDGRTCPPNTQCACELGRCVVRDSSSCTLSNRRFILDGRDGGDTCVTSTLAPGLLVPFGATGEDAICIDQRSEPICGLTSDASSECPSGSVCLCSINRCVVRTICPGTLSVGVALYFDPQRACLDPEPDIDNDTTSEDGLCP